MVRAKKVKPTLEELVKLPSKRDVKEWVVVGIDPSLSRTGLSLLSNSEASSAWESIASLKPASSSYPSWIRAILMANYIKEAIHKLGSTKKEDQRGLIITLEAPTPSNDWLILVNKIFHVVLIPGLHHLFSEVYIQHVNAMTLRSCLGLKATGNNKYENIQKAQEYAPTHLYPGIDTDSCDAILLAQFGRYTSDLFLGKSLEEIPGRIAQALCDYSDITKGKGRNAHVVKKGIIYNPAYWFKYVPAEYSISIKDARIPPKKRLGTIKTTI